MTDPGRGALLHAPDMAAAVGALRERGMRVSAARRLVLESLFAAGEPISAERIAAGLGGRIPQSEITSVYRNLEVLEQVGLVRHFHLGHGPGLYVLTGDEREYLVCERCRRVQVVQPTEFEAMRASVRREFGFEVSFAHFPMVGLCGDCAGKGQRGKPKKEEHTRAHP